LLWLLAAGIPREGELVALTAPAIASDLSSKEFEVRAVRLWQRTLCLRDDEPLTSGDFRVVNDFRRTLLQLQRRRPHRLAGIWKDSRTGHDVLIECLDEPCSKAASTNYSEAQEEKLSVSFAAQSAPFGMLRGRQGETHWQLLGIESGIDAGAAAEAGGGSQLQWTDGTVWTRGAGQSTEGYPLLGQIGSATVQAFESSARTLFGITCDGGAATGTVARGTRGACGTRRRQWPARLVPFRVMPEEGQVAGHLAPLDLGSVERCVAAFAAKLRPEDVEGYECDGPEVPEVEDFEEFEDGGSDDEDDASFDLSQQRVDEEYMWRLAEKPDCSPADSRALCLVESALAMPTEVICSKCELEGKTFSKSQLARHPDDRTCQDCVAKAQGEVYRAANHDSSAPMVRPSSVPDASVVRVAAMSAYATPTTSQVRICAKCNVQLTKDNCSSSQGQKAASRRHCKDCVASAGNVK